VVSHTPTTSSSLISKSDNMRALWAKVWGYVKEHQHHFMISIGVSLVITILTNVIMHYFTSILHFLHVPAKIVHLITGN
jgi:hypothetical protein